MIQRKLFRVIEVLFPDFAWLIAWSMSVAQYCVEEEAFDVLETSDWHNCVPLVKWHCRQLPMITRLHRSTMFYLRDNHLAISPSSYLIHLFEMGGLLLSDGVYSPNRFMELKYEVVIVSPTFDLPDAAKFFNKSTIIELPSQTHDGIVHRLRYGLQYAVAVHKVLASGRVKLIHFSTTNSSVSTLLSPLSWRIPKILTFYGATYLENSSYANGFHNDKYILSTSFVKQKLVTMVADRIITFSNYAKHILTTKFGVNESKITIIPGCVKLQRTAKKKNKAAIFTIVNIGRAEPRKGIDLLLRAAKIINKRGFKFRLLISSPFHYYTWFGIADLYQDLNLFDTVHLLHRSDDEKKHNY